jgi:hypothetical protein
MLKSSSLCLYSSNLGTFWLKIEQFWRFEEISIFSNSGHLGYRTALTGNDPYVVPFQNCVRQHRSVSKMAAITKNRNFFKWPNCSILSQKVPKFELYKHNDGHLGYRTALTDTILKGDHTRIIAANLVEIGSVVSEEKIFFNFIPPFF